MALNLCNALSESGINVPDDILISGYDGSREAMDNVPSITTIYPENGTLGAKAVLKLHKMITGIDGESVNMPNGGLILAGSCGCSEGFNYVIKQREAYKTKTEQYERYYNSSGMLEGLSKSRSLDHLLHKLTHYMYLLVDVNMYAMCLNKEWEEFEKSDESNYLSQGYPDIIETQMIYKNPAFDFSTYEYDSTDIVPDSVRSYYEEPKHISYCPCISWTDVSGIRFLYSTI